jgi:hypothetical protein
MIWHTNISWLQFFGYAIALAGLLYYSLGWDQIVLLALAVWASVKGGGGSDEQGGLPSAVRRSMIMGVAAVAVLFLVGGFFYGGGISGAGEQLGVRGTS